jgi:probable phosphoglycerate mutase
LAVVGCGASVASILCTAVLWLRLPPPWFLAERWAAPEVRRASWDAFQRRKEIRNRPGKPQLRILLIRHGQSLANTETHKVSGLDLRSPLTEKGEEQARLLGRRLRNEGMVIDRVFSSHAVRAKLTAVLACEAMEFPVEDIQEDERVVEFSQGGLSGRPREEVYRKDGPIMRAIEREAMFFRPPGVGPDNDEGESRFDVEQRFQRFIEEKILQPYETVSTARQTVAIFTHAVALRSWLRSTLGAGVDFVTHSHSENTSITEVVYDPSQGDLGGWILVRANDAAHLQVKRG